MRAKPHSSKGLILREIDGVWHVSGTINKERFRRSLGTRDEETAKRLKADLEAKLWKRSQYGDEAVRTFEEAAISYLKNGGKKGDGGDGTYLPAILKHFKGRVVGTIKPAELRAMANAIYPGRAPATKNRQAIVPARSVIMHAHDLGWCGAITVKQFDVPKSRKHRPVDREWMVAFMAEADKSGLPHLSALVLFMHETGTRVSEAIRIEGHHVDLGAGLALLVKTKTDEWVTRQLTGEVVARLSHLGLKTGERVFGYTDPKSVNRVIKRVAGRAGIDQVSTHSAGRHSFATNAMAGGANIKDAMDAGGWKSAKLFMETYVHSHQAGKNVAAIFDRQKGPIDVNEAGANIKRRRNARKS
jgi:integrase